MQLVGVIGDRSSDVEHTTESTLLVDAQASRCGCRLAEKGQLHQHAMTAGPALLHTLPWVESTSLSMALAHPNFYSEIQSTFDFCVTRGCLLDLISIHVEQALPYAADFCASHR